MIIDNSSIAKHSPFGFAKRKSFSILSGLAVSVARLLCRYWQGVAEMTVLEIQHRYYEVVKTLEEEVVLGVLFPNQRLVEDDLMVRFNLKRHVVRQVLTELEQMGLVHRKRNVGALVRAYTAKEVEDLYAVRMLLEGECARIIRLPIAEADLSELKGTQAEHDRSVSAGDLRGAFRANMRFHRQVFALSDNETLVEAIQAHAQRCHSIRSYSLVVPEQMERARLEHWAIIKALETGDREGLIALCSNHLIPARDVYLRLYHQRSPQIKQSS